MTGDRGRVSGGAPDTQRTGGPSAGLQFYMRRTRADAGGHGHHIHSGLFGRRRTRPADTHFQGHGCRRTQADKWRTPASIRFEGFFVPGRSNRSCLKVESCKSLRTSLQLFEQSPGASQAHSGQDDRLPADVPFPAIPNLYYSRRGL